MMANLGYGIAQIWTPVGVAFNQWATFHGCALVTLVVVTIGMFIWYVAGLYRSIRILQVNDVFRQRVPWLRAMFYGVGLGQLVLCLVLFFALVRHITVESVVAAIATGVAEGTIGLAFFWLFSMIGVAFRLLPVRVKYIPWPVHLFVSRVTPKD